jgi:hypothetical protein
VTPDALALRQNSAKKARMNRISPRGQAQKLDVREHCI